jgi:RimJ/RimL family protein N-acetyltransferase
MSQSVQAFYNGNVDREWQRLETPLSIAWSLSAHDGSSRSTSLALALGLMIGGGLQVETKRLILRRLIVADAPALFRTVGDPDVMRYWAGGADATSRATAQKVAEIAHHWKTYGFGD